MGRRKTRRPPDAIDIAERIRRRALDGLALRGRAPANDGDRAPPGGTERPGPAGGSAAPLSLADAAVCGGQAAAAVKPEILRQAAAILRGRLEARGPVVGPREVLGRRIGGLLRAVLETFGLRLTLPEQNELVERLLDEMIGRENGAALCEAGPTPRPGERAGRRGDLAGAKVGPGEGKGRQSK